MRARHIRRIRKKLVDKKWLERRLRALMYESKDWNNFWTFECSSFFQGSDLANYNKKIHNKGVSLNNARIEYIEKHLKQL